MTEPVKFVRLQNQIFNISHLVSVKKSTDSSAGDADTWTLTIEMVGIEPIRFKQYPQQQVHQMFAEFEKLLAPTRSPR